MADVAEDAGPAAAASLNEEIKPYRIHVSTKYLDLTKQKLELTRLPHEGSEPKSEDWWEPKSQVEPLIDYWLEKYRWRDEESRLNGTPQFRTAISITASEAPLRIHFLHIRSSHTNALPLLLIPPFPFSNLSLAHLVKSFTDPEDVVNNQPFHLVIPSLPGIGFSDPLPNNSFPIGSAGEMLNTLMTRLHYPYYLVSNAGAAQGSPAEIDWKLVNYLATHHTGSCLGAHFISPPLASPKLHEAPLEWAKWSIASFFHAGILGYSDDDFSALRQMRQDTGTAVSTSHVHLRRKKTPTPAQIGLNRFGLREPNTLAYAMCDSPTGLLVVVLKGLRLLGPRAQFSPEQIITLTQLSWLPGPEYAMRFWAHCAAHDEEAEKKDAKDKEQEKKSAVVKPKVAITVFLGGKDEESDGVVGESSAAAGKDVISLPREGGEKYVCPAWGNAHYEVVYSQRTPGKPGLLAWERPEVIAEGVRGLAKQILAVDKRLEPVIEPPTTPLERVVVDDDPTPKPTPGRPGLLAVAPDNARGDSSSTQVAQVDDTTGSKGKEIETSPNPEPKGKELETSPPPLEKKSESREAFSDGGSPGTIVVTPPLDSVKD